MANLKLIHYFTAFRSLGGVEAVLQHHHASDVRRGIDSEFIIYFEKQARPLERVHPLELDASSTIRLARARLRSVIGPRQPDIAVHHTVWGMPYLSDLDRSRRRILVLHAKIPNLASTLKFRRDRMDGVICMSAPLTHRVRECLPHLERARNVVLPYPIHPPARLPGRIARTNQPWVLGYCGRLSFEQKRVERIPKLCSRLDERGLNYRMEFLGEGSARPWLENVLTDRSKFRFHGRKDGEDYWRILSGWDGILFVSDYEGLPIALLEAMSAGVIPFYPSIDSGAESYATRIRPDLVYKPEEYAQLTKALSELSVLPESELEILRDRCRAVAAPHVGENYLQGFSTFVRQILELPKVSKDTVPRRLFFIDNCPFSWLARLSALRRAVLRACTRIPSGSNPATD